MEQILSLKGLASSVQEWCEHHGIVPATGQAAEKISERTIRYYRTLGLVDPPVNGTLGGFGEKHRLQLIAIRLLQAQGLPLRKIRELLYGRSLADLREIERRGISDLAAKTPKRIQVPSAPEDWKVIPITDDYLLVSRQGQLPSRNVLRKISDLLSPGNPIAQKAARLERKRK